MPYRLKPKPVEAHHVSMAWFESGFKPPAGLTLNMQSKTVVVGTFEGLKIAKVGDWIVRPPGRPYIVLNKAAFEAAYEEVPA